ncbi:2'-5' RNA ligase family protein [Tepidibacillus marianensis]|uniref:2'-5' RNA ligase family protein n=1 Tax=Tepidibacillus marianensis TaxID=3131995 RepID=UPI0030CF4566
MKYGILIYPSREIQDRANALRKRYDSHYSLIPPHVTIVDPFEWEYDKELIDRIERVVQTTPPFSLKLNKVGTFLPISPVVYFGFEKNDSIHELHENLTESILDHGPKFKFTPHLTIAQDLPEQELHDILGRLKMKENDLEVLVDRVHLCYQLENGSWTVYQTFLLKGNA